VVGEKVYRRRARAETEITFPRLALHAAELAFEHPADGRPLRFEAPRPADLAALLEKLRRRPHVPRPAPRPAAADARRAAVRPRRGSGPARRSPKTKPRQPVPRDPGSAPGPSARLPRRQRKR